jgi:hypothetical protein
MPRPLMFWILLLATAAGILLTACDEKVTVPEALLWAPEHLAATVNDSIVLYGVFEGEPTDVSRFSWDVTSDGIFDFVFTNQSWPVDTLGFYYAFAQPGEFLVTLQVTTVTNKMYRSTTEVSITDNLPMVTLDVPHALACGEIAHLSATVIDDGGFKAWWDIDANGSPDLVVNYVDTLILETDYLPGGPGVRSVIFGTLDNDNHRVEERVDIIMGLEPEWAAMEDSPAPMDQGRWGHTSVLHDGKVYVFGGRDGGDILDSVEIYDTLTDTWVEGAPAPAMLWQSRAYAWGDSIYLMGGYEPNGAVHLRTHAYHPASDTWADYDPADEGKNMPQARIGFGLDERRHQGEEGFIMLFGGFAAGDAEGFSMKYDVDPGNWTHDFSNEMRAPRRDFGYADLNGFTWTAGGTEDGAQPSGAFERYDPDPKVWVLEPDMPTPRTLPAMAALENHLYLMGGATATAEASKTLEVFDLENESWHSGPDLPLELSGATAHVIDGKVYLFGGRGPDDLFGKLHVWQLTPWRCSE